MRVPALGLLVTVLLSGCVGGSAPVPERTSEYRGAPLVDRLPTADDLGDGVWIAGRVRADHVPRLKAPGAFACNGDVGPLLPDRVRRVVADAAFTGTETAGFGGPVELEARAVSDVDAATFATMREAILACDGRGGDSLDGNRPFVSFERLGLPVTADVVGIRATVSNFSSSRTRHVVLARALDDTLLMIETSWTPWPHLLADVDWTTSIRRFQGGADLGLGDGAVEGARGGG